MEKEKITVKEKFINLLERFFSYSQKFGQIGKLKFEVTNLKQKKFLLQKEIGEEVYSLYKKGLFENLDLKELLDKLGEIEGEINELEEKIKKGICSEEE